MSETENKVLIILCCCFYPQNKYSINDMNIRNKQYIDGINKFFEYNIFFQKNNIDICLVDNSISREKNIPQEILNVVPKNINIICHDNNNYGSKNKGGGLIENWLYMKEKIEKYNWIIHF